MKYGVGSGALWGLDTVILGIGLLMIPFLDNPYAAVAGAGIHDLISALNLLVYMGVRGRLRDTWAAVKTRSGKAVIGAALLGGPVGMTGYLFAISNIGPGYTAIISSFYPALGTLLAYVFLKERMKPRQLIALLVAIGGIVTIGMTSMTAEVPGNALLGVGGALLCVVGWGSEAVILSWGMRDDKVDNETALQIRQLTSTVVYMAIVIPFFGAFDFAISAIPSKATAVLALAALAGTASYLFYYKAIASIGASRGMALNISYSGWAVIFGLILVGTVPGPVEIISCIVILIGTALAATSDWNELLSWKHAKLGQHQVEANTSVQIPPE